MESSWSPRGLVESSWSPRGVLVALREAWSHSWTRGPKIARGLLVDYSPRGLVDSWTHPRGLILVDSRGLSWSPRELSPRGLVESSWSPRGLVDSSWTGRGRVDLRVVDPKLTARGHSRGPLVEREIQLSSRKLL